MADAFRGIALFLAAVAMLLALRLGLRYLVLYIKAGSRVRHAAHVMPMATAFLVTTAAAAYLISRDLGEPADWKLAVYPLAHVLTIWGLWSATHLPVRGRHAPRDDP